jgi:4-hydroxy-tetrahydrodipicolinate synthase
VPSTIVTPFTPDSEQIIERVLRALVDQNVADGVDGFIAGGDTGELSVLSRQEQLRLAKIVTETD